MNNNAQNQIPAAAPNQPTYAAPNATPNQPTYAAPNAVPYQQTYTTQNYTAVPQQPASVQTTLTDAGVEKDRILRSRRIKIIAAIVLIVLSAVIGVAFIPVCLLFGVAEVVLWIMVFYDSQKLKDYKTVSKVTAPTNTANTAAPTYTANATATVNVADATVNNAVYQDEIISANHQYITNTKPFGPLCIYGRHIMIPTNEVLCIYTENVTDTDVDPETGRSCGSGDIIGYQLRFVLIKGKNKGFFIYPTEREKELPGIMQQLAALCPNAKVGYTPENKQYIREYRKAHRR